MVARRPLAAPMEALRGRGEGAELRREAFGRKTLRECTGCAGAAAAASLGAVEGRGAAEKVGGGRAMGRKDMWDVGEAEPACSCAAAAAALPSAAVPEPERMASMEARMPRPLALEALLSLPEAAAAVAAA